jgi:hypothetical protein
MVRYDVSPAELEARIDTLKPAWRSTARAKTEAIRARGRYDKKLDGEGWGDIKPVFMALQANKCAYCERKLSGPPYGNREHDVEHFRPKSRLRAWPDKRMHRHLVDPATGQLKKFAFPLGSAEAQGYALLAFEPLNYCTACARCNQSLKSDFFPVRGTRVMAQGNPARLKAEKAFLLYPIGRIDDDPAGLITFAGVVPKPVARRGFKRERAEITIDFFALDSEDLAEERADILTKLFFPLQVLSRGPGDPDHAAALEVLRVATSARAPHSRCARAFQEAFDADPALARQYFDHANEVLRRLRPDEG